MVDPQGESVVFTVDSHGVEYFFYVLQAVVLLTKCHSGRTRVVLLPFEPLWRKALAALRKVISSPRQLREGRPRTDKSVYRKLCQDGSVEIARHERVITFERASIGTTSRLGAAVRAAGGALRIWTASFDRFRFAPLRFLRAVHRSTHVGDLAAATYFRSRGSTTHLLPRPILFYWLWKACYMIELAEGLVHGLGLRGTFTITPELSYVHCAPYRYLYQKGSSALDIFQSYAAVAVVPPGHDLDGRAQSWHDAALRSEDGPSVPTPEIESYFRARLYDSTRVLWYMNAGQNDNQSNDVLDSDSRRVVLDPDGLHAIVFLHSFADAQYYFGLDGFEGLAHWTFHSIESCLRNERINRVFIKPHPATDYRLYPGDRQVYESIRRRHAANARITILHPRASIVKLSEAGKVVGLTHHGSIAEELVYLGQPVIASAFAPWGDRYRFARLWSNPEEHDKLIQELDLEGWTPPTPHEKLDLWRYIVDYRLCELHPQHRDPATLLARLTRETAVEYSESDPERLAALEQLGADDRAFDALLDEFERLELSWVKGSRVISDAAHN